jgi:hypothetical protein
MTLADAGKLEYVQFVQPIKPIVFEPLVHLINPPKPFSWLACTTECPDLDCPDSIRWEPMSLRASPDVPKIFITGPGLRNHYLWSSNVSDRRYDLSV